MKTYRWLTLIAALLITLGVVVTFVCTGKLAQLLARAQARRRLAQAVHRLSGTTDGVGSPGSAY